MNALRISALLAAVLLTGCDVETWPATPAQHEQAKADCEPHGGPEKVVVVQVAFRTNRVDATCKNGVRISRDAGRIQ